MAASRCAALARSSGPWTTTSRNANGGWRSAHASAPHSRREHRDERERRRDRVQLPRVIPHAHPAGFRRTGRRRRIPACLRRHRHERVAGHPRRRVHLEKLERAVRLQDQVEPAPAAAAHDAERRERRRPDLPLLGLVEAARTEVLGLVGEVLVVVVVVALRAPRSGSAAARGRPGSTRSVPRPRRTPRPARDRRAAPPRHRRARARRDPTPVTFVMPIVEPSRAGFTISGRPSSATTRIQSVAASTTRIARRRDAAREPHELGAPLVHRQRRGHHAAARVAGCPSSPARPARSRPRRTGRAAR